jgi:hypothetical protein
MEHGLSGAITSVDCGLRYRLGFLEGSAALNAMLSGW